MDAHKNANVDPEEALLPELGFSPPRLMPVEVAAQHHLSAFAQHHAPPSLLDLHHSPLQSQQQHHQQQHGNPLNALTTLAVAAAPQNAPLNDGSAAAAAAASVDPLLLADPNSLHAELLAKEKEIKALRRALSKAQRKTPAVAPRDSTASMIGEAVLSLTKDMTDPQIIADPNKIKNLQERWKARFQQLVRFKLKHGHCNVPKSYEDKSLHAWVRKQRINKQIRDRSNGVKGLATEQVEALESIGFEWVVGHQPRDDLWQANYERLVQLYALHGYIPTHCNDKSLTKWMQNQRARRKLLENQGEGKARGMNWDRVQKLDAIGFTWDARK